MTKTDNSTVFLAVCLGNKDGKKMQAWSELPEVERQAKMNEGIAAWGAWCEKYKDAIVEMGGPLGKTKKVSPKGVEDVTNELCGCMMFRAASHEAAAKMFEKHPHFTIFPGDSVEIMPVMAIPTAA